jgi:hypothetical protein
MSFDLTAHVAHEDSLLEGAGDVPEATVLPDSSGDAGFFDAWKIYGTIAVSPLFITDGSHLKSFTGRIHRRHRRGTRGGPHAQH